jgi:hypothetical protein
MPEFNAHLKQKLRRSSSRRCAPRALAAEMVAALGAFEPEVAAAERAAAEQLIAEKGRRAGKEQRCASRQLPKKLAANKRPKSAAEQAPSRNSRPSSRR